MKTIYAIKAMDGTLKYVGSTNDMNRRTSNHNTMAFGDVKSEKLLPQTRYPIYEWMREVGPEGYEIVEIGNVSDEKAIEVEKYVTDLFSETTLNRKHGWAHTKASKRALSLKCGGTQIYQYDLDMNLVEQHVTLSEASIVTGINKSALSKAANGKISPHCSHGGTHKLSGYYWYKTPQHLTN